MPRLDKTGLLGQGSKIGRGLGLCGLGLRRGFGCFGGGYGYRRFISPKNEMAVLQEEEEMLKEELAATREEISALNEQKK